MKMRSILLSFAVVGAASLVSGCVVAPPRAAVYVDPPVVVAPPVVVRPYYGPRWWGYRRW